MNIIPVRVVANAAAATGSRFVGLLLSPCQRRRNMIYTPPNPESTTAREACGLTSRSPADQASAPQCFNIELASACLADGGYGKNQTMGFFLQRDGPSIMKECWAYV